MRNPPIDETIDNDQSCKRSQIRMRMRMRMRISIKSTI